MLIKKKRISDEIVAKSNDLERKMATDPALGAVELAHHIGARDAFLSAYNMIKKKNPQSDEIAIEDIDQFCWNEFRLVADTAYSAVVGLDFPYDKKIALGKISAYKNIQSELERLKSELQSEEDED